MTDNKETGAEVLVRVRGALRCPSARAGWLNWLQRQRMAGWSVPGVSAEVLAEMEAMLHWAP
jgi:hypothetical protein